ncbi:neuropeptide FF receptor 2-like [Orbicella faveolata]|uniref:neuropeptide FF receptor 2-like n=1 Tax=Orbicella faveolata TaxID=48498 RepID=UPI0009E392A2|nr:neuropeptide FF receptor 2-like [Orbicella faveolata]
MNETTDQDNKTVGFRGKEVAIVLLIRSRKEVPLSFSTVLSIVMFLVVLGVILNGAICFVMLREKRFKKNTSNFFILHLSVTELVIRLLIGPIVVYSLVTTSKIESIQCKFLSLFFNTFGSATFISLAAIATDRYQNIVYPMKALKSRRKTFHLVFIVWLYAIIVSIPGVVNMRSISISELPEADGMDCKTCSNKRICDMPQNAIGQVSTTSYFVSAFLIPLTLIFVLYTKIVIVLHQRRNNGMMHKVAARSKSKAVRMLVLAVIGYALSLGPGALLAMLRSYGNLNNTSFYQKFAVSWIVEIVQLTSSLGNPIIYAYYNGDFRKELLKLFCRKKSACSFCEFTKSCR